MKTIYNTYVVMESQEQCDRMKQLCIDNNLHIWGWEYAFEKRNNSVFEYDNLSFEFYCSTCETDKTQVTEQEFIELLNQQL